MLYRAIIIALTDTAASFRNDTLQAAHGANINNKLINTATNDEEKEGNGQGQYEGERQAETRDVAKSNQTKAVDENQSPNVRV